MIDQQQHSDSFLVAGKAPCKASRSNQMGQLPKALTLLSLQRHEACLIPTPQTFGPAKPLFRPGFSVFSDPGHFGETSFQPILTPSFANFMQSEALSDCSTY